MPQIRGDVEPGFEPVRTAFSRAFTEMGERGAAAAGYLDGRPVVDLWAGDAGDGVPWRGDTLVHVYSVSKPFAAACVLRLIQDGRLELDTPVASVWPAFAAAGKGSITIRWLLTHQAGLMGIRRPLPPEALVDHDAVAAALAAEEPWWEPGTAHGEHALVYGHLLGEVVRRVDGRTLGSFLRATITDPLDIDLHIGLTDDEIARCATVSISGAWRASVMGEPGSPWALALGNPPGALDPEVVNSDAYRRAEIPAINGHGTARGIARFYGALSLGGELDGISLLLPETVAVATSVHASGRDRLIGEDVEFGLGFGIEGTTFGMAGIGGSFGYGDRERRFGFAYVTRLMGDHARAELVADAFEACVDAQRASGQPRA